MTKVCLDANVWIKFLTEEPDTDLAEKLIVNLMKNHTKIIAPSIMKMEVGSILRKKYKRKLINQKLMYELWHHFLNMPIIYHGDEQLYTKAWEIAELNDLTHLYDAVYLALSDEIEFWTADERLVNSISKTKVSIKFLRRDMVL